MKALTGMIFGTPLRAAIICGLAIAIVFGYFAHPDEELIKRASDLNIASVLSGPDGAELKRAYDAARDGDGSLVELDKDAFKERAPLFQATFPAEEGDGRRFLLRHVGQDALGDDTVYVWEETVFAAPWWSPHRFAYKAVEAQTGAFGEVVALTFERDVPGLIGLLLMDAIVGTVYGIVIGAIVAVVRGGMEVPGASMKLEPRHAAPSRRWTSHPPAPLSVLRRGGVWVTSPPDPSPLRHAQGMLARRGGTRRGYPTPAGGARRGSFRLLWEGVQRRGARTASARLQRAPGWDECLDAGARMRACVVEV